MLIFTAKMPRRRILLPAVLLLAVLTVILLVRRGGGAREPSRQAATNEERVAYLEALGWKVVPEPVETLGLKLPDELTEPYLSYNVLQKEQGFDLTPLCGRTLNRYTYRVLNFPNVPDGCLADLYLCDGVIVAGDVICTGEGGFIAGLDFPKQE